MACASCGGGRQLTNNQPIPQVYTTTGLNPQGGSPGSAGYVQNLTAQPPSSPTPVITAVNPVRTPV